MKKLLPLLILATMTTFQTQIALTEETSVVDQLTTFLESRWSCGAILKDSTLIPSLEVLPISDGGLFIKLHLTDPSHIDHLTKPLLEKQQAYYDKIFGEDRSVGDKLFTLLGPFIDWMKKIAEKVSFLRGSPGESALINFVDSIWWYSYRNRQEDTSPEHPSSTSYRAHKSYQLRWKDGSGRNQKLIVQEELIYEGDGYEEVDLTLRISLLGDPSLADEVMRKIPAELSRTLIDRDELNSTYQYTNQ